MKDSALPFIHEDLNAPVGDRFLRIAGRYPHRTAIIDANGEVTYNDLARDVLSMSSAIVAAVGAGEPVALLLPTTRSMPCAMLAALLAGCPYVPLDPGFPAEHLQRVLSHSGARVIICDREQAGSSLGTVPDGISVLTPGMKGSHQGSLRRGGPDSAAYILYTSGSTGKPKGVWQDQRGLLHDVMQFTQAVDLVPSDRLSLLYSPAVNGAIRDIYGALLNGAALCMSDLRSEGLQVVLNDLERREVTVLHAMPPVLRALMRTREATICPKARVLYTAGDRLLPVDLERLWLHLPRECAVYTGIGSTECATLYRHWIIPHGWCAEGALVPVGHEIPEREMRLVDESGRDVPTGEIGLIEVASPYIARGYWNDPALTDMAFRPVPHRTGWRTFRPGDLGRLRADGLLEFMGRADRQIKVRGYRLDPVEIEAALRTLPGVSDAVVLADDVSGRVIVQAFVETSAEPDSGEEMRRELASRLPPHLVPERIVILSAMPRLANFKCDIEALRRLTGPRYGQEGGSDLPVDYLSVWAAILKRPVLGTERLDTLGADSLSLMEVEFEVAERFGKSLRGLFTPDATPFQLWEQATDVGRDGRDNSKAENILRRLSILMSRSTGRAVDPEGTMRAFNERGDRAPLIWCFNDHVESEALAAALGADQPLLAFRSLNGIVQPHPPDAMCERIVVENALRSISSMRLPGAVFVGGNCQAARIAMGLANGLWMAGVQVASLILMEQALAIPYAGRQLVLFGVRSMTHNPRLRFAHPEAAWRRYAPNIRRVEIPGAHGEFFQRGNVSGLASALREEIDLLKKEVGGPIGQSARCVRLTSAWILEGDMPTHLRVSITNCGSMPWAQGADSGIALTIHLLRPPEEGRPLRKPDLTVPLPFPMRPDETRDLVIPLKQGFRQVPSVSLGVCEEGYEWFEDVSQGEEQA